MSSILNWVLSIATILGGIVAVIQLYVWMFSKLNTAAGIPPEKSVIVRFLSSANKEAVTLGGMIGLSLTGFLGSHVGQYLSRAMFDEVIGFVKVFTIVVFALVGAFLGIVLGALVSYVVPIILGLVFIIVVIMIINEMA